MRNYTVKVIPKRPAYNDSGSLFGVIAKNQNEAISKARKLQSARGDYDRHDGPLIYIIMKE